MHSTETSKHTPAVRHFYYNNRDNMTLLKPSDRSADVSITVNGRAFRWPRRPTAVICFDGCDPDSVAAVLPTGAVPTLARMMREGYSAIPAAVIATLPNPNNVHLVCGAPPPAPCTT